MHWKGAFDSHSLEYLSEREAGSGTAFAYPDHDTFEGLAALSFSFDDLQFHLEGIARAELRDIFI